MPGTKASVRSPNDQLSSRWLRIIIASFGNEVPTPSATASKSTFRLHLALRTRKKRNCGVLHIRPSIAVYSRSSVFYHRAFNPRVPKIFPCPQMIHWQWNGGVLIKPKKWSEWRIPVICSSKYAWSMDCMKLKLGSGKNRPISTVT